MLQLLTYFTYLLNVTQVDALNTSLSDSSTLIANLKQRLADLQRTLASSEQDRRVLQERFDNAWSAAHVLRFIHLSFVLPRSVLYVDGTFDLRGLVFVSIALGTLSH